MNSTIKVYEKDDVTIIGIIDDIIAMQEKGYIVESYFGIGDDQALQVEFITAK